MHIYTYIYTLGIILPSKSKNTLLGHFIAGLMQMTHEPQNIA